MSSQLRPLVLILTCWQFLQVEGGHTIETSKHVESVIEALTHAYVEHDVIGSFPKGPVICPQADASESGATVDVHLFSIDCVENSINGGRVNALPSIDSDKPSHTAVATVCQPQVAIEGHTQPRLTGCLVDGAEGGGKFTFITASLADGTSRDSTVGPLRVIGSYVDLRITSCKEIIKINFEQNSHSNLGLEVGPFNEARQGYALEGLLVIVGQTMESRMFIPLTSGDFFHYQTRGRE